MKRLSSPLRFGIFEVDPQAGELCRRGLKIKLQDQPFQVLVMLLEHPSEVVTREELQKKLWHDDTFVDFERGLNRAINKLREALADDADSPRFIETLPRRGYRFIAPVEAALTREPGLAGTNQLADPSPDTPRDIRPPVPATKRPSRPAMLWVAASVLAGCALLAFWRPWLAPWAREDRPFLQLDLDAGPDGFSQPAISSDGMRVVIVAKGALSIRRLDQAIFSRLAGTEGASVPFFSPNGQWVAFFADHKLKKVNVEGGGPLTLCDAPAGGGGTWGDDGNIIAGLNLTGELSLIPAAGGAPEPFTDAKADAAGTPIHRWPQALPGGKGILYAATDGSEKGSLRVLTPHNGLRTVIENSTYGRYLTSGYLVYHREGTLFAVPMDPLRMVPAGPAVPIVEGVSYNGSRANFDLSDTGTLIYRGGTAGTRFILSWLYSSGKTMPMLAKPRNYLTPRLSPDGARLALSVIEEGQQSLWVYDLKRETWTRLTSDTAPELIPVWTPDSEFLAFRSGNTLSWTRSDGSAKVQSLKGISANAGPWSFSADGKWLAFWPLQPGSDLWIAPVGRTPGSLQLGMPQVLLKQAGSKGAPSLSPDGHWLAYTSDASGTFETYVMPFSQGRATGGKWQVSNGGGWSPVFSRTGRKLFFQSPDRRVQVAEWTAKDGSFISEKPHLWSGTRLGDTGLFHGFDVAPDGTRVLAVLPAQDANAQTLVRVLLNVDSELRRRALGPEKR